MPIEISNKDVASIVKNDEQALQRAIYKWVNFMQLMWGQITDENEDTTRKRQENLGMLFRVMIIILSTLVTTISDISEVPRTVVTVIAGLLTMLTGIEAYFRFVDRGQSIQRKQRELQALRDELRYRWMIDVELEPDFGKRMEAAKKLLENGPKAYNGVLNKYVLKSKESETSPQVT